MTIRTQVPWKRKCPENVSAPPAEAGGALRCIKLDAALTAGHAVISV